MKFLNASFSAIHTETTLRRLPSSDFLVIFLRPTMTIGKEVPEFIILRSPVRD